MSLTHTTSSACASSCSATLVTSCHKKYYSEPVTPINRPESPAVHPGGHGNELKLINEIASSFSKNNTVYNRPSVGPPGEHSPGEPNTSSMKRASSTDSKRGSPHPIYGGGGSGSKRESPAMRREGSFAKKESPTIQRKLSAR